MAIIGTDIDKVVDLLNRGDLVSIPTETVYGLAGNALNPEAVTKIFTVKNRPTFDPLIVHVASLSDARNFAEGINSQARELAEHFWPGPLTLLLPKKEIIPDIVTAGLDRVGIRCPDHSLTRKLLNRIGFPLAAPSANPFGYVSPTTPQHVQEQLGDRIPYILDGGPCHVGIESTIVGWEDGKPVIYRMGGVSIEEIQDIIGPVIVTAFSSSQPQAPGQLQSHYAPKRKVFAGDVEELYTRLKPSKPGVLLYRKKAISFKAQPIHVLSATGDLNEGARNLFGMLRAFDHADVDVVLAEFVPDVGLGRAINDRLRRASHLVIG